MVFDHFSTCAVTNRKIMIHVLNSAQIEYSQSHVTTKYIFQFSYFWRFLGFSAKNDYHFWIQGFCTLKNKF